MGTCMYNGYMYMYVQCVHVHVYQIFIVQCCSHSEAMEVKGHGIRIQHVQCIFVCCVCLAAFIILHYVFMYLHAYIVYVPAVA